MITKEIFVQFDFENWELKFREFYITEFKFAIYREIRFSEYFFPQVSIDTLEITIETDKKASRLRKGEKLSFFIHHDIMT